MARTRNYNIYYQNDYLQDADVIEDNKTTAESVDEALGTIDQKVESNTQNINNNTNNIELNARNIEDLQTAVAENSSDIENLENAVANKVDKVTGKGLSTNDFTNEYKNQVDTNKSNIETLQTDLENANSDIETLQGDVETALSGKEDSSNKVTSIDENSTNTQYPSAKLVYDELVERDEEINQLWNDHPDILDNNALPSGTDLTLNGTGDLKMKVDVEGNSTQVQYEGYNLLPNTAQSQTISGVTFTVNDDKTILVNGTANAYIEYTISRLQTINFEENEKIYLLGCPTGGSDNTYTLSGNSSASLTDYGNGKNMTVSAGGISINGVIKIKNGTVCNNLLFKPMVISGNTKKPYEPFVGNQISPNPNYKQDINNVEGNVVVKGSSKNLVNLQNENIIIYSNYNNFSLNKNIIITTGNTLIGFKCKVKPNSNYTASIVSKEISGNPILRIREYSEEPTNWENNFISQSQQGINANTKTSLTITTNSNCEWVLYVLYNNNNGVFEDLQLEQGSTATPYVPFGENTVTFPLATGQKLMLGDTLEDDGIHHKRGKIVLTGTESISSSAYGVNSYTIGNLTPMKSNETDLLVISSHFKGIPANQRGTAPNVIYTNTTTQIEIRNTEFTTLQEFTTWLATLYANNTPVIVEYELETETTEAYTSAQQTAYNKLKEMQSYYDLTHVVGSSDNAQPIMTVQAKKSLKVMQDEIDEIKQAILNS